MGVLLHNHPRCKILQDTVLNLKRRATSKLKDRSYLNSQEMSVNSAPEFSFDQLLSFLLEFYTLPHCMTIVQVQRPKSLKYLL